MGDVEVLPKELECEESELEAKKKSSFPKFNFSVRHDPEENLLEFKLELDLSKLFGKD